MPAPLPESPPLPLPASPPVPHEPLDPPKLELPLLPALVPPVSPPSGVSFVALSSSTPTAHPTATTAIAKVDSARRTKSRTVLGSLAHLAIRLPGHRSRPGRSAITSRFAPRLEPRKSRVFGDS
jgi:hypothetical protein